MKLNIYGKYVKSIENSFYETYCAKKIQEQKIFDDFFQLKKIDCDVTKIMCSNLLRRRTPHPYIEII